MDKIKLKKVFVAVFDKSVLDSLLSILVDQKIKVVGTKGTVDYLKSKGVDAQSVVDSFDFGGRVKSLDKKNFAAILADPSKENHLSELAKLGVEPLNAVIVDLYVPDRNNFPETMDIGGQALIRAAIKNFENVAVAFDRASIDELADQLKANQGSTLLEFRRAQAKGAAEFIAQRANLEAELLCP